MLYFNSTEEAKEWGQSNLNKYEYALIDIDREKTLLCHDNRCYEQDIWGTCYELLEKHKKQVGEENLPKGYDTSYQASQLRDMIINHIEKNSNIRYLDCWDEY